MDIEHSLPWQVSLARKVLIRSLEQDLTPLQLNAQQFAILRITEREGTVTPGELAERLHVDRPTVSRLLRTLKQRGWLRAKRSLLDARHDELRVTARGQRHLDQAREVFERFTQTIEADFSDEELSTLLVLLSRLTSRAV